MPAILASLCWIYVRALPALKTNSRGSVALQVLTQDVGLLCRPGMDSPFHREQRRTSVNRMGRPKEWRVRSCLTHLARICCLETQTNNEWANY